MVKEFLTNIIDVLKWEPLTPEQFLGDGWVSPKAAEELKAKVAEQGKQLAQELKKGSIR